MYSSYRLNPMASIVMRHNNSDLLTGCLDDGAACSRSSRRGGGGGGQAARTRLHATKNARVRHHSPVDGSLATESHPRPVIVGELVRARVVLPGRGNKRGTRHGDRQLVPRDGVVAGGPRRGTGHGDRRRGQNDGPRRAFLGRLSDIARRDDRAGRRRRRRRRSSSVASDRRRGAAARFHDDDDDVSGPLNRRQRRAGDGDRRRHGHGRRQNCAVLGVDVQRCRDQRGLRASFRGRSVARLSAVFRRPSRVGGSTARSFELVGGLLRLTGLGRRAAAVRRFVRRRSRGFREVAGRRRSGLGAGAGLVADGTRRTRCFRLGQVVDAAAAVVGTLDAARRNSRLFDVEVAGAQDRLERRRQRSCVLVNTAQTTVN